MLIATCTCIYTKSWMRILNVSIQYVALYINTCLHTSTIITKSSSFTDRHTMVHHYASPCMCSTGICLTMWTKKLFCYKQNKKRKKMFDTGMKLKKEKKRKSRFIARLRSTLSRTCCSVCLSLWEIYTVYCSCSLYGTTIPDPELLRQFLLISIILS